MPLAAQGGRQRDDGLWVFPRREFCEFRFDYRAGQHVVFAGPTQRAGKTTLCFDLLEFCATPDLPAYIAVSKPVDPVTSQRGAKLGYRRVSEWPPGKKVSEIGNPPSGYLVWPRFGNMDTDEVRCARITRNLLMSTYTNGTKKKKAILVLDDTMVKSKLMGLDREMTTIIAMAGAMGIGEWVFVQKTTDSGRTAIWSYGNSEHLFLSKDPDERNRKRFDEIGGVDPRFVSQKVMTLRPYEFLYLERSHGFTCIVGAE